MVVQKRQGEKRKRQEGSGKKKRKKGKWRKTRNRKEESRRGARGGVKKTLEQGGVFADVDKESLGRPASGGLDDSWRDTMFGEGSSTTRSHRLSRHVILEEELQTA